LAAPRAWDVARGFPNAGGDWLSKIASGPNNRSAEGAGVQKICLVYFNSQVSYLARARLSEYATAQET
jgi:hypothetical protein